jgi:hypothetical protein
MQITPFEVYCDFLALKQHFTKESYDYLKYHGKVKARIESFHKRKDRYFYEKLSRNKNKQEVFDYFLSNFIDSSEPSKLWIGDLKGEQGEEVYLNWLKRVQALSYTFSQDLRTLTEDSHILDCIRVKTNTHPPIIKSYLKKKISIETIVILNSILDFYKNLDEQLSYDPVWKSMGFKLKKYEPFLNADKNKLLKIFREIVM